jgi:hypothetical protein
MRVGEEFIKPSPSISHRLGEIRTRLGSHGSRRDEIGDHARANLGPSLIEPRIGLLRRLCANLSVACKCSHALLAWEIQSTSDSALEAARYTAKLVVTLPNRRLVIGEALIENSFQESVVACIPELAQSAGRPCRRLALYIGERRSDNQIINIDAGGGMRRREVRLTIRHRCPPYP